MRPFVIGIAGGTGSGKTVLAEVLLNKLGGHKVALIQQDSYYKDLSHIPFEEREIKNFDDPNALDNELFEDHLEKLIARKAINAPIYDFSTHTRKKSTKRIEPKNIIIAEGSSILVYDQLRKLIDFKIFLDVDSDIRFIRRLKRDMNERRRTLGSVLKQYLNTVRPMYLKFIDPCRAYADLVINNNRKLDDVINKVLTLIKCPLL